MLESGKRTTLLTALAIAAAFALSGCSLLPGSDTDLTLAETKSPVQLLRNSAASRISETAISDVLETTDQSVACRTPDKDPVGLLRQWRSTIQLELKNSSDPDVVSDELTASFVDQGWVEGYYINKAIIELTKGGSETVIHLSSKVADDETGDDATEAS